MLPVKTVPNMDVPGVYYAIAILECGEVVDYIIATCSLERSTDNTLMIFSSEKSFEIYSQADSENFDPEKERLDEVQFSQLVEKYGSICNYVLLDCDGERGFALPMLEEVVVH